MKRRFTALHLVVALVGGAAFGAIGFWEGSRIGVQQFEFADSKYKASILALQLEALKHQDLATLDVWMQNDFVLAAAHCPLRVWGSNP